MPLKPLTVNEWLEDLARRGGQDGEIAHRLRRRFDKPSRFDGVKVLGTDRL